MLGQAEHNAAPSDVGWECDMLERLRTLSHSDRQAILLFIKDKQRIQQLEQQLSELGGATSG